MRNKNSPSTPEIHFDMLSLTSRHWMAAKPVDTGVVEKFKGKPKLNPRFLALDNVHVQPHHASSTCETRKAMGKLMHDNLTTHFTGQPLLTPVL